MSEKRYLCIQRSTTGPCDPPSPSQMQGMYEKFNTWRAKYEHNIVDMGGKLSGEAKVVRSEGATDGPFVEAKEVVGGYMIVQAESMEAALEVVQAGPGAGMPGSSIEIREIASS